MGPLYPFALRHFGAKYAGCDACYDGQGLDQMERLVQGLREDPYSRRHVVTTFNPSAADACALPPCHGICIQFFVDHLDGGLSCHVVCRSSDAFLGLPFNIASYGLLAHIVAARAGALDPRIRGAKERILSTGDTHLHINHLDQARRQASRTPLPCPRLSMAGDVARVPWERLDEKQFDLIGYLHHPPLPAPMAV